MPYQETIATTQRQNYPLPPSIQKNNHKTVGKKMAKPMNYKGYPARIEYDDENSCFTGRVIGIKDIITFQGKCVVELKESFKEAIDLYLATCVQFGKNPKKPYSGKFMLRIPTDIHAAIAKAADSSGKSLNQWVNDILKNSIHE
ncbi:MAG: type II toxin-antitoxin system HicB family antitoxin [Desulfobulbaceae bacterium]|nr:type II toxin-antitoxin system HicB family antitoxin [Desulfobulbaceae bacterium]